MKQNDGVPGGGGCGHGAPFKDSFWFLVFGFWFLVFGCRLPVAGCRLPIKENNGQ
jgi:hypothetical protein